MLTVFLVEDEIVVRENIRETFPWEEYGFSLIGEAPDGEIALPLIEELKPDILITDIKMPFMDGLELSRILRQRMPWMKIIILSGHDEFSYAREAVGIGVSDYILKPIGPEDLLTILRKAENEIREEQEKKNDLERLKRQVAEHTDLVRERFLSDLAQGIYSSSEALRIAQSLSVNISARYYCVCLLELRFHRAESGYQDAMAIESIIQELIRSNDQILEYKESSREFCLLFRGNDAAQLEEDVYKVSRGVKAEAEKQTDSSLSVSIGSVRERISGISQSMSDARIASGFDYIFGNQAIIGISDAVRLGGGKELVYRAGQRSILNLLQSGEYREVKGVVDGILEELNRTAAGTHYYAFALTEIIATVFQFVEELGGDGDLILPEVSDINRLVEESGRNIEGYKALLTDSLGKAMDLRNDKLNHRYGDVVKRAYEFIGSEFSNSSLALADVAAQVNMSAGHFSTVFSQETGSTFIEHLTRTRIDRAKELLRSTSAPASEIAYQVGYNDSHYFSHIFKQKTGQTPGSFRKGV